MLRIVKNEKGITLIEIMASLIILSIVSLVLMQIIRMTFSVQASEVKNHNQRLLYHEVVVLINNDVKKANNISVTNTASADVLTLQLVDGTSVKYKYDKASNIFYHNNKKWFVAKPISTHPKTIEHDVIHNTISFHLLLEQEKKPPLPLDFIVSPRFKKVE